MSFGKIPNRPNHPEFRWEDIFNYSDTSSSLDSDRIPATSSVFVLPKGSLLFSYDNLFGGKSEVEFKKLSDLDKTAIMIQQMIRLSMADSFSWDEKSKRYEIKSARTMATLKYFYPTPYGGLGVHQFSDNFNCCWVVMTTCDICVAETISAVSSDLVKFDMKRYDAYFQDGISTSNIATKPYLKDANIQHRRNGPLVTGYKNYYDFKFLNCGNIPDDITVRPGNSYDICLEYEYSEKMVLSGTKGIAGSDSIVAFNENLLKPIYNVKDITDNIEDHCVNTRFSAFVALQEANIALKTVKVNETILKLNDLAYLNTAFFLSDRFYATNEGNPTNITRLNYSIPEYALNPFGYDQINNHYIWGSHNDPYAISDTYIFPYDQWGVYLKGGIQKDWIKKTVYTPETPLPEMNFTGIFKNCKLVPIGLILSSSENDPYTFINFKNLKYDYDDSIKYVTEILKPESNKIIFPIKLQNKDTDTIEKNRHRIRSFYISSLMYFNSFESNTLGFNSLKKLFYATLNKDEGFDKKVKCYNWDTSLNKIASFHAPLLNYSCVPYDSSNIYGFINACIIKDLIQTYLAVKYRHLKYNKGIYTFTDDFNELFFNFNPNLISVVNAEYADVKVESTYLKNFLLYVDKDLFDNVRNFFKPNDCFLPSVNFSPLFPLPSDHDDNNIKIDTISDNIDTIISYFHRRFCIMFWFDKNETTGWSSCTQISLVFLIMVYVAEYSKKPLFNFQHSVLVPAGFDILSNDIIKTKDKIYENDDIIDKEASEWDMTHTQKFKSFCNSLTAVNEKSAKRSTKRSTKRSRSTSTSRSKLRKSRRLK